MALWDLVGKAAGLPLHKLWGGAFRTEIPFYGYIDYKLSADEAGLEAARLAAEGYGTIYRKIGLHEADDLACLAAIRAAIGPDVKLRVDANQSWSVGEAVEKIKRMVPFDLEYVDQPVLMYNVDELAQVRALSPVRIAAHESSWTMYEALNVIKRSAADAIHVDPRFDAGMMGARITAGMAEAAGLPTIMHHYTALGVTTAAYCQLIAAAPSFTLANQTGYAQLSDDVILGGLMPFRKGCLRLPEGPGIGVTLDPAKVEEYAALYQRDIKGTEFSRPWMTPRYMMMQYRNFFEE
jgi:L-alanine-DL-glutamate epimerase-like enolase superfamily enzyme